MVSVSKGMIVNVALRVLIILTGLPILHSPI